MQQRAEARRKNISITKVNLHSKQHHSFHPHLDSKSAWELLAKLSQETWKEQTGQIAPSRVNKSIVKFIHLDKEKA